MPLTPLLTFLLNTTSNPILASILEVADALFFQLAAYPLAALILPLLAIIIQLENIQDPVITMSMLEIVGNMLWALGLAGIGLAAYWVSEYVVVQETYSGSADEWYIGSVSLIASIIVKNAFWAAAFIAGVLY